jgi:uncharacterized repeat protein (TIGR01451 family)
MRCIDNFLDFISVPFASARAFWTGRCGGGAPRWAALALGLAVLWSGSAQGQLTLTVGANTDVTKLPGNESDGVIALNPLRPAQLFIAANTNVEQGLFGATSANSGTSWTTVSLTNLNNGAYPAVAWDGYGNLFLAYADGNFSGIHVAVSTNGGTNFSPLAWLVTNDYALEPRIAVGSNSLTGSNSVWVLYKDFNQPYNPLVAQGAAVTGLGRNNIGAFGLAQVIPGSTNYCGFGDIAVGPQGQVMVAYQNLYDSPGTATNYVCVDMDGLGANGFSAPIVAGNNAVGGNTLISACPDGQGINAAMGLAWDTYPLSAQYGRVYLVNVGFGSTTPDDTDIYVSSSTNYGLTWSPQALVNDDGGQNSKFLPSMAVDPTDGALALNWYDCRARITSVDTNISATSIVTNDPTDMPPTNFTTNYTTNYSTNFSSASAAAIFATVSLDGGMTFQPNVQVSKDTTNGYLAPNAVSPTDFGDYTGLTFYGGGFYPVWADNSNPSNPDGTNKYLDVIEAPVALAGLADVSVTCWYTNYTSTNWQLGSVINYFLTARNNGPSQVTAAVVTDIFPPNVSVVIAFPTNGGGARTNYVLHGNTLTWPVGALAIHGTATMLVRTTAVGIGTNTNSAAISPGTGVTDLLTNNNVALLPTIVSGAFLGLSITAAPPEIGYEAPAVTYTLTVTNNGPVLATGVVLSNTLPPNLVLTGVTLAPGETFLTNSIVDTNTGFVTESVTIALGTMTNGQLDTVFLTAIETPASNFVPGVVIDSAIVTGIIQANQTNNTAQASITLVPPDMAIGVTGSPGVMAVGDTVTYTLSVTNLGPVPAYGVAITNYLPPNLLFSNASVRKGTYTAAADLNTNGQTDIIATLDDPLGVGQNTLLTITATALSLGPSPEVAVVGDAVVDLNPANNTAQIVTQVVPPDMAVGLTGSPSIIAVGDSVTYTIVVSNLGPVVANGIFVTNLLPTNLLFTGATVPLPGITYTTAADASVPGQTDILFNLGTNSMAPGQTLTLTVTATAQTLALSGAVNTNIVADSQIDPNTGNNTAQAVTFILPPDMAIGMTGSPASITIGQQVVYTVSVTNLGPVVANGVVISNFLPPTLQFVSAIVRKGTYTASADPATNGQTDVVVTLSEPLPAGRSTLFDITAVALSLGQPVTLAVVSDSQIDINLANNTALVVTPVVGPDMAIGMSGSPGSVFTNETVTYTLNVTNLGPVAGTGVAVTNTLTTNLALAGVSLPLGTTYSTNQNVIIFNIGAMSNGQTVRLTVTATALSTGKGTNAAVVGDSLVDNNQANNTAKVATTITAAPAPFSNLTAGPGVTGLFITWNTPSNSTSQVTYGLTTNASNYSYLNPTLTTNHAVLLTGLIPDTNYYFQARSITAAVPASDVTNGSTVTVSGGFPAILYTTNGTFTTTSTLIFGTSGPSYSGPGWLPGSVATGIYGSNNYYYVQGVGGNPTASAVYTPPIGVAGLYDISVWYPTKPGAFSSRTPMYASGATNQVFVPVDQTVNGANWQPLTLGMYFATGTGGNLTIYNNTGDTTTSVAANAARWVYEVAQDAPATTNSLLPGWWANHYFGTNSFGATSTNLNAAAPAPGGYSYYAEYVLGADPTSSSNQLHFVVTPGPSTNVTVTFAPWQGGRTYQLQSSSNLGSSSWVTLTNTPTVNTNNGSASFTVGRTPGTAVFYRLEASLLPVQ